MSDFPWDMLGLEGPADTRAIKRAYAARLKKCRPEDDAEGFAALRRAYECALSWAADPVPAEPTPEPVPAADPIADPIAEVVEAKQAETEAGADFVDHAYFDAGAKADQILAHGDSDSLSETLHADEALWNLAHKHVVSVVLARRVTAQPLAVGQDRLSVLAAFFHWDDVGEQGRLQTWHVDVLQLRLCLSAIDLRRRLDGRGELQKPYAALRRLYRWGTGPLAWGYALVWTRPTAANAVLQSVPSPTRELLIEPRVVNFWARMAGDLNLHRFALHLLRANLIAFVVSLVHFLASPANDLNLHLGMARLIHALATELIVLILAYHLWARWATTPLNQPLPLATWPLERWPVVAGLVVLTIGGALAFPADAAAALAYVAILCCWLVLKYAMHEDVPAVIRIPLFGGILTVAARSFAVNDGLGSFASRYLAPHDYDIAAAFTVILAFTTVLALRRLLAGTPAAFHRRVPAIATLCAAIWGGLALRLLAG